MFRIVSVYKVGSVEYIVAEFSGLDFDIFSTVTKLPFNCSNSVEVYHKQTLSNLLKYIVC